MIGTRGAGSYGGFETCLAEVAPRLGRLGHDVRVYARRSSPARHWRSEHATVVTLPSIPTKNLDTITHTALSAAHLGVRRVDAVLCFGVGNSPFAWFISKVLRIPVVLNVDGLDRQRRKWGRGARWYLHLAERLSVRACDVLVTDARTIETYYREHYGASSTFIPYGAPDGPVTGDGAVRSAGVEPGGYVLYVSRLEPENNAHVVIEAHARAGLDLPLVVVGGSAYDAAYEAALKASAGPGVVFTGFVFGDGYRELQSHAAVYTQCTEVGGTHPALVEAMGFGNVIIALDTPEHREVLGDAGRYYTNTDEFVAALKELAADPEQSARLGAAARARAAERYSWDAVAEAYQAAAARAAAC